MLKLLGIDSSFKAPAMLDQPVINASDFRGEAFGILARAQQANLEAQKNRIINTSSTDIALQKQRDAMISSSSQGSIYADSGSSTQSSRGGRSSQGGSSKEFDPRMDVSEREKWEYDKQKEAAKFNLDVAKFQQDSSLDERKFGRDIYKDERDFARNVLEDERDYTANRDDESFRREMDVSKFSYQVEKDTTERNDKIYEEKKREFQAQQYALAQQGVQELVLASEGLMRKGGGLEAIRGGLTEIFKKYPGISPEMQSKIIETVYSTPQRVNREQIQKTESKIEEVQQFQRNTVLQAKRIELQSMTAALKTATGSKRQTLLKGLTKSLGEFASGDGDPLTKAMVLSNLYKEVADKGEVGADVQQKLLDYASYSRDASKLYMMRNKMSPSQYALQESALQQKYGVTGFRLNDTNFDTKTAFEGLKTATDLKELRTKNAIDAKFGMNADKAVIAQLAKSNANPAQIAALEAMSARYGRPPALEAAIKLAKDSYAHREKAVEVQTKLSTLEKEEAMIMSSDAKSVLDMLEGDKEGNMSSLITTAMLSQANPKLAEALSQKRGIDPETKAEIMRTWKQQRQRIVQEINIQKKLIDTGYQMERDYLSSYYDADNFAALDAIRGQMPQLRSQVAPQPVGVRRGATGLTPAQQAAAQAASSMPLGGSSAPQQPQSPSTWAERMQRRLPSAGATSRVGATVRGLTR